MTELLDPTKKPTLSIPEAAEVLGISRHMLYSLAKSDSSPIPILRFGKRYCLPTARLLEFLQQGPAQTTTSAASTQVDANLVAGSAHGAKLVAVIERQTAELRRVGIYWSSWSTRAAGRRRSQADRLVAIPMDCWTPSKPPSSWE